MLNSNDDVGQSKCVKVTVIGRVQGVGFRYYAQAAARRYDLVGWVRNNYNGTVEIYAEGTEQAINGFLKVIRQGPSSSHVSKVNIHRQSCQKKFNSFTIRT